MLHNEDTDLKVCLTCRLILGTIGGFYYFIIPVYMLRKHLLILPLSLVWKDAHKKLM